MKVTIKSVFDDLVGHLVINKQFAKTVKDLRVRFLNKNEDHLDFFTGNLLGVHVIKYLPSDRENWFEEVLEIDEDFIKEGIAKVGLDPTWVRVNDVLNLSIVWLLHRVHLSTLSPKEKYDLMIEILLIVHYKFISSLMSHYFPYPANKAVAMATYEALSRKFELKQYGSWQALLEARSRSIIDSKSIHFKTITDLPSDQSVILMVQDMQARVKEIVRKMSAVFHRVNEQNLRISSSSGVIELDGETELLGLTRDHTAYTRYLKDIISDKSTFIRQELIDIIVEVQPTLNEDHLIQALFYCSENFGRGGDPKIETLIDECLLHTYEFISDNTGTMSITTDLGGLLIKLRNLYTASRMGDERLVLMKKLADSIVERSVKSKNQVMKSAARTGLQLYLVIRAFTKKHYQG